MKSVHHSLCLILFCLCLTAFAQESKIPIYQKAKIYVNHLEDIELLTKNGIAIDHGIRKSKTYLESIFSIKEIERAKKLGYKVEVIIDDMRSFYLERAQNAPKITLKSPEPCDDTTIDYTTPSNFNLGSMGGYLTYTEVLQELDDMRTAYPNLITAKEDISTFTTEDGNTIQWVKISDNPDSDEAETEVLYNALHHAREPASLQQLIFFMWYLLENYATDTEVKAIVDNTELYFIPVVNPDGYLYNESTNPNGGGLWRKNRRDNGNGTFGVDNNRNYDYYINGNSGNGTWGGAGSSSNTSSEIYRGTAPFSEVENQAIKWFVEQHDFKIALNNHTFGEIHYFPFGYADVPTPEEDVFYALTTNFTSENEYDPIRGFPSSGDSDDYMYGTVGTHNKIYAMTPEIGDSFWPPQNEIIPLCKSLVYTNLITALSANNYAIIQDAHEDYFSSINGNIDYNLRRLGVTGTGNFTVSVMAVSSNITSVGSANSHNGLSLLESRSGSITYQLDPSITIGDTIEYKLIIDNGLYEAEIHVSKIMGPAVFMINDNGDNLNNWTSSTWSTTTNDFKSATSSITDSPSGNYNNSVNNIIELTDEIDLTNAGLASIQFYAKWDIEAGFDYVQFEISTNNGVTWEPQCGNFTRVGNSLQGINGQPMYDGVQNEWVLEQIDLTEYIGENIKGRFQLVTDSGTIRDGFYFDDFKVFMIDQSSLSTNSSDKNNIKVYPNPVIDKLTLLQPNALETSIELYAISGQLLKRSETSLLSTEIDLRGLSQGVYMLKLNNVEGHKVFKIVKK